MSMFDVIYRAYKELWQQAHATNDGFEVTRLAFEERIAEPLRKYDNFLGARILNNEFETNDYPNLIEIRRLIGEISELGWCEDNSKKLNEVLIAIAIKEGLVN